MKIRAGKKDFQTHLVTTEPDGTEQWWKCVHVVQPAAVEPAEAPKSADIEDVEWTHCEWVVESGWREGSCGRGAARNRYGLSLCWQHEDAAFSHVRHQIGEGRFSVNQTDSMAESLLRADGFRDSTGNRSSAIARLADRHIEERLEALAEGVAYIDPRFAELLDRVIETRLQQKWGTTA